MILGAVTGRPVVFQAIEGRPHAKSASCQSFGFSLLQPESLAQFAAIGPACLSLGDGEQAVETFRRAAELYADSAEAAAMFGAALEVVGKTQDAQRVLAEAFSRWPNDGRLAFYLTRTGGFDISDGELERREQLAQSATTTPEGRMFLLFAVAKARDRRHDYAKAFRHLETANALRAEIEQARGVRYDRREHARHVDRLIELFTPTFFSKFKDRGSTSEIPVLVVGMPRSGTTLVEQIVASHPSAAGVGESEFLQNLARNLPAVVGSRSSYPDCLAKLTKITAKRLGDNYVRVLNVRGGHGSARVVDKMWANFLRLGLAAMIAPGGRVIHCVRDPLDTCLSCFFANFSHPLPFVYRMSDLGY
jgi:tetratricopeptide (TPR) repeat protein